MISKTIRRTILMLAVIAVSFSAVLVIYGNKAPSTVLVFYRMGFAALLTAPFVFWKHWGEFMKLGRKDVVMCLVSGVLLAFHFAMYFESLNHTSIASSLVILSTDVFFVAFLMMFLYKEKLVTKSWIAIIIAFVGSIIVSLADMQAGGNNLLGDILSLLGAFFFAVHSIFGRLERATMSTSTYTFLVYASAASTMATISLLSGQELIGYGSEAVISGLGMAIICTLLGHTMFSWGLKYEKATYITVINFLEPVFGSAMGWMFFGEVPAMMVVLGATIMLIGMYMFTVNTEPEQRPNSKPS